MIRIIIPWYIYIYIYVYNVLQDLCEEYFKKIEEDKLAVEKSLDEVIAAI